MEKIIIMKIFILVLSQINETIETTIFYRNNPRGKLINKWHGLFKKNTRN